MSVSKNLVTKDVTVHYDVHHENEVKTIVFIHGFGVNKEMWNSQILAFESFRIINIDVRGHGKSRPCGNFDVILAAQDVKDILIQENIKKAAVVGLSMGSYVAQELYRLYPDMISGLFLADGTPIFMKYPLWEKLSLKYSAPILKLYSWNGLKKTMAKQTAYKPDVQAELLNMFNQMTRSEFMISWRGMTEVLHEENIQVTCPMYFVYGEKDSAGTIKMHAKDWKVLYPNCNVVEIKNAGHLSNMDNPESFNRILLELLERVE